MIIDNKSCRDAVARLFCSFLAFVNGQLQSVGGYCTHDKGDMTYTLSVDTEEGRQQQLTLLSVSLGVNTHTHPARGV